jgi:hypothetical protein
MLYRLVRKVTEQTVRDNFCRHLSVSKRIKTIDLVCQFKVPGSLTFGVAIREFLFQLPLLSTKPLMGSQQI